MIQTKLTSNYNLNPWWITGYTDGDGCFMLNIISSKSNKVGYSAVLVYQLVAHYRDKDTLNYNYFSGQEQLYILTIAFITE